MEEGCRVRSHFQYILISPGRGHDEGVQMLPGMAVSKKGTGSTILGSSISTSATPRTVRFTCILVISSCFWQEYI